MFLIPKDIHFNGTDDKKRAVVFKTTLCEIRFLNLSFLLKNFYVDLSAIVTQLIIDQYHWPHFYLIL
jgi:hypothetical protein